MKKSLLLFMVALAMCLTQACSNGGDSTPTPQGSTTNQDLLNLHGPYFECEDPNPYIKIKWKSSHSQI